MWLGSSRARHSSSSSARAGNDCGLLTALLLHEPRDLADRIEILGHQLVIGDDDRIPLLQVTHQLEDAGRIDDAPFLEGVVVCERKASRLDAKQKVIDDECPQFLSKG